MDSQKIKAMVFSALMAALMCIAAPIAVPIGPVPITLATFVVYLAGAILDWKSATVSVVLYILLGLVGLPVFSGYSAGAAKLFGATGGYIIGYIGCVFVVGFGMNLFAKGGTSDWITAVITMLIGTLICYAVGTAWFLVQLPTYTFGKAMAVCVVPFLPGDAAKIVAATALGVPVRRILRKQHIL